MNELEVTWSRMIRVWWLVLWRSLVSGFLLGLIAGFVLGFTMAASGVDKTLISTISGVLGTLLGFGANLFFFRSAFRKSYKGFRIVLVTA